jgi:hypothetical protein
METFKKSVYNTLQYCCIVTSSRLQEISVNRQNIFEGREIFLQFSAALGF